MKKRNLLKIVLVAVLSLNSYVGGAQGMAVNTTGAAANSSAILDVSSNTQGVLVPRMAHSVIATISSPATGLLVYQTDATGGGPGFMFYNGSAWVSLSAPTGSASGDLAGSYPNPTIANNATSGNDIVTALGSATSGTIPAARLGTSSGTSTTFLNGSGAFTAPFSLTTTGSSGAATFSGGTLNIPTPSGGGSSATGASPQGIPYSVAGHFISSSTIAVNYNPVNSVQLTTTNGIGPTIVEAIPGTGTVTVSMTIYSFANSSITWSLHSVSPPASGTGWTDNGVLTISSSAQCSTAAWSSGSPVTCTMSVSGVPAGSTYVTLECSPNASVSTGSFLTAFSAQ